LFFKWVAGVKQGRLQPEFIGLVWFLDYSLLGKFTRQASGAQALLEVEAVFVPVSFIRKGAARRLCQQLTFVVVIL
jgi:hypothetical protein